MFFTKICNYFSQATRWNQSFLSQFPLNGVYWDFKVDRRILLTQTVIRWLFFIPIMYIYSSTVRVFSNFKFWARVLTVDTLARGNHILTSVSWYQPQKLRLSCHTRDWHICPQVIGHYSMSVTSWSENNVFFSLNDFQDCCLHPRSKQILGITNNYKMYTIQAWQW